MVENNTFNPDNYPKDEKGYINDAENTEHGEISQGNLYNVANAVYRKTGVAEPVAVNQLAAVLENYKINHQDLSNTETQDCHPTGAITGLNEKLATIPDIRIAPANTPPTENLTNNTIWIKI